MYDYGRDLVFRCEANSLNTKNPTPLDAIAEKRAINPGREEYGDPDLQNRDWIKNIEEELADANNYICWLAASLEEKNCLPKTSLAILLNTINYAHQQLLDIKKITET